VTGLLTLLALVAAVADKDDDACAETAPLPAPVDAALYQSVAAEEEAAGELEIAARAYREAWRRDPSRREARAAWQRLCAELRPVVPPPPRLSFFAAVRGQVDSNVALLPTDAPPSSPLAAPEADGAAVLLVSARFRPRPEIGLGLDLAARKQLRLDEYDRLAAEAQAGFRPWRWGELGYRASVETLGGAYAGLRQEGEVALRLGRWRAGYRLVGRLDALEDTRGFRGLEHHLEATATAQPTELVWLRGGASLGRADTREPLFDHWEGALVATTRIRLTPRTTVGAELAFAWERYDALDLDDERRRDLRLEGTLDLELWVSRRVVLLAEAEATLNRSTVADFDFGQLVVSAGVGVAWGER
jgi:hypothetical protein